MHVLQTHFWNSVWPRQEKITLAEVKVNFIGLDNLHNVEKCIMRI